MYYTKRYNLKTGDVKVEGKFETAVESEELCKQLCEIENQDPNTRCVFITEETEEPGRTHDEAITDIVLSLCEEMGYKTENLDALVAAFKMGL